MKFNEHMGTLLNRHLSLRLFETFDSVIGPAILVGFYDVFFDFE